MNRWYEAVGNHSDIVLSSRVRLARNVIDYPFHLKMSDVQRRELNEKVKTALQNINLGNNQLRFLEMKELSEIQRYAMVERHCVSPAFIRETENRLLVLSDDESISIMVNEEDHLRIQVLGSGLQLPEAYALCSQIDQVLDETLRYAFDEKLGYLTSCPTNLGTGLRASVMMHLPALEKSGLISSLTGTIGKLGLTIRGTYGEGSSVLGSIYQISNQITLGITEQDSIQNLESVVMQIMESEKQARESRIQNQTQLEDVVYRSLGALRYARLLSGKEFYELYSNVRLGVSSGIIQDVSIQTLNELLQVTGTASICEQAGKELPPEERDALRSRLVREKLQ